MGSQSCNVQFNYGSPENTRTFRSATSTPFSSQMRAGYNMKESGDDVRCCLEDRTDPYVLTAVGYQSVKAVLG